MYFFRAARRAALVVGDRPRIVLRREKAGRAGAGGAGDDGGDDDDAGSGLAAAARGCTPTCRAPRRHRRRRRGGAGCPERGWRSVGRNMACQPGSCRGRTRGEGVGCGQQRGAGWHLVVEIRGNERCRGSRHGQMGEKGKKRQMD